MKKLHNINLVNQHNHVHLNIILLKEIILVKHLHLDNFKEKIEHLQL